MSQVTMAQRSNKTWIIVLAAITMAGAATTWWATRAAPPLQAANTASPPAAMLVQRTAPSAAPGIQPAAAKLIELQQEAAAAVAQHPGFKPYAGPVTERPPYVSLMEWTTLQLVSRRHPHPEEELTRMVNFLLFAKQMELWQSGTVEPAQRRALAEELLAAMPARVKQGEIELAAAKRMEQSLIAELASDAQARQKRIELETKLLDDAAAAPDKPR